jgi:F-type H+-transporting ATPase subunit delta
MPHDATNLEAYADALLALGRAANVIPRLEDDLTQLLDAFETQEPLRRFLHNPHVQDKGKQMAVRELLGDQVHPMIVHLIEILIEQHGLDQLPQIASAFFHRVSQLKEKAAGELVSARPLSREQIDAIEAEVSKLVGKDVHLHVRTDVGLLGGLFVRVGDRIIDGTLDTQLERIRHHLVHVPVDESA